MLGFLGGLASSALSYLGQRRANKANIAIARENRAWQERMSNTAYQRSARDLQAAGLNRILALGKPATTPGGNVATMQNELAGGISSALEARLMNQQIKNLRVTADNIRADTRNKEVTNREIQQRVSNLVMDRIYKGIQTQLNVSALPGAQAQAGVWSKLENADITKMSLDELLKLLLITLGRRSN